MEHTNIFMFLIGGVTFALMLLIKIPIKKCTWDLADRWAVDDEDQRKLFHRLNLILVVFAVLVAVVLYCFILIWMGDSHFKFCCSLKGAAIAMAFYAIFEQWTGTSISERQKEN